MSEPRTTAVEPGAEVTPDAIMQLGTAFWASKTLLSAVELGVFSELAQAGALDGEDGQAGTQVPMRRRDRARDV